MSLAAVVLAGGASRRLGGAPKPALPVGGRPMLLRVLDAVAPAHPRVVVGPPDLAALLPAGVLLTREDPPGGGPVAGLAAGLALVSTTRRRVAVLSADLPFLAASVLSGLSKALDEGGDVAVLLDGAGREQWLCAVWDHSALAGHLAGLGDPTGVPMRALVGRAAVRGVALPAATGPPPWFDVDTDEDIRRAEQWLSASPSRTEE
jgi:molybdopterin-guanine dinucleotide biosynthesis protein A